MSLSLKNYLYIGFGLFLILGAYLSLFQARKGLEEISLKREGVPMRYIGPTESEGPHPGVIIAHGFAGSKQLMLAYAYTFARAGYACLLPDFVGHGANPRPMPSQQSEQALQDNLDLAYQVLRSRSEVDPSQLALLGHSMGSGAVLRYSLAYPERFAATIAISPSARGVVVSDSLPRNLLLQAGEFEAPFVATARRLLEESGGIDSQMQEGLGRDLQIIEGVEHISILFHKKSHHTALSWLDQTFGRKSSVSYADGRIPWFWGHVLGWLLLALGLMPVWHRYLVDSTKTNIGKKRPLILGQLLGPLLAVGLLVLIRLAYSGIGTIGGLLVGGGFALWVLLAGGIWVLIGLRPRKPERRELMGAIGLFLLFFLSYGWIAEQMWLPFFLNGPRLMRWLPLSLGFFPWFLATGYLLHQTTAWQRVLWWLVQSILIALCSLLIVRWVPELRFLVLMIPVLPIVFGVCFLGGTAVRAPWSFAIASSLFLGWQVAMLFPLSG
ncbi:MAG: alpha/beta fold hydrolase [Bacteroidota bacterium]